MSETWLTYSEAAAALGTSPEAVRQKSIREHWHRQRGNDGKTRVLIDLKAQKPRAPRKHPAKQANVQPDEQGKVAALEANVAALKEAVANSKAVGEHHRLDAATTRNRLDEMIAELVDMSKRMAEQAANHDACRRKPWWKRLAANVRPYNARI
jgi:ribosomal protein L32E